LLPYILFEKYFDILASEMANPENRHCASFIGALSFPLTGDVRDQEVWCVEEVRA